LDSFFASVEVREHPELKGKPVVVGSYPKGGSGSVVSTCSYEARKYGIHSSMPISKAYKLCPDCAFLPVNMQLYKEASANVMVILRGFAEKFEQVSVDEAYLVPCPDVFSFDDAILCVVGSKTRFKDMKELLVLLESILIQYFTNWIRKSSIPITISNI